MRSAAIPDRWAGANSWSTTSIIIQLLGRMGVDFPEDGGNFFCKVTCKQHGKTLGDLPEGFQPGPDASP